MFPTFGATRTAEAKENANVHHQYDCTTDVLLLKSVPIQLETHSHAKHDHPNVIAAHVGHQMGTGDVHINSTEQAWRIRHETLQKGPVGSVSIARTLHPKHVANTGCLQLLATCRAIPICLRRRL